MPKHASITDAAAKRFTAKSGRVDHFDSSYPGLALRVSKTGVKAWTYFYRMKNSAVCQRRMTLGNFPAMNVQEAHDAWRHARDLIQAGRDPRAGADDTRPALSFESVFEEWLKRDQGDNKSAGRIERRIRSLVLPAWKNRLITDIDRRAALAVIDDIADRGKIILARRVFGHLHRLFVWCVGRDILKVNPLQNAEKPGSEVRRDRVLTDAELAKVWEATDELPTAFRDAFRLLALTGARRSEISQLRWGEVGDGAITLEGERTKTGVAHIIPLSSAARSIIATLKRGRDAEYVFSAFHGRPITNWARPKITLDEVSGVTGWTIHDVRRTVATGLQRLGVALPVTEAVLGHSGGSRGGIVGVYQRHDYAAEKASALEAWGAHVTALIEKTSRGKVVRFGRG